MELVKKLKADEETTSDICTLSRQQREMNAWRDSISQETDISKKLDADFNVPKMHLMSHWAKQICG
jgi:hypothetical protein